MRGTAPLGLLVVLLAAAASAQAVLAPVSYEDPVVHEARVYHGLATSETNDEWEPGPCTTVVTEFELTLVVPEAQGTVAPGTTLELQAEHTTDGDPLFETMSALATPGDPATLEVEQGCGSPTFTVAAVDVPLPTKYRVECTDGCYTGPPSVAGLPSG